MEFETNYYNHSNNKGGFFLVPSQETIDFIGVNPPLTCHSGLNINPRRGPFWPQFCPVNPFLAGLIELGFNPDVLIKMEVQRSMSLLQVI